MRYYLSFIFIVFSAPFGRAQMPVNNTIDPTDTQLVAAVTFINKYISEFAPSRKYLPDFCQYWTTEDCHQYRIPDRLVYAISTEIPTYMLGKPTLLMARPEQDMVHIKLMFSRIDSAGSVMVSAITNHYIQRGADGTLRFVSPMRLPGDTWQTTTLGSITYHYPAYHQFSKKKAKELADEIDQLQKDWQVQPIHIEYYFADTKEEIDHYRGFDFTLAMGNRDKPSGISDGIDNIVYCGGLGENYLHEVVHVYLNRLFPQSPLTEGLAVFYGGSMGHTLSWHLQYLNRYLQQHPETDLNNPNDFYYLDNNTNPRYTIQGLLCFMAYSKAGIAGLRRTMQYTSLDTLLLKEYGVERNGWNKFLREQVDANSPKD